MSFSVFALRVVQSVLFPQLWRQPISTPVSALSACEMWLQHNQFTNVQIPFSNLQVVRQQQSLRLRNHPTSERSKAPGCCPPPATPVQASDGSKTSACDWYLVVSVDGLWCKVCKFTGSQLHSTSYRVKLSKCFCIPDLTETTSNLSRRYNSASYPEDIDEEPPTSEYIDKEPTPLLTPRSTQSPDPAVVPSKLATPRDPQPDIHPVPESSTAPSRSMTDDIGAHISELTSSPVSHLLPLLPLLPA